MTDAGIGEGDLAFTGERFVPGTGGTEIAVEHAHRYRAVVGLVQGKEVVDLGSGSGYGAALLAGHGSYTGYDIAPEAVTFAGDRFGGSSTRFELGDVTAVNRDDDSADVVVCFEVLEHVKEPAAVVREARRILRSDGLFISSTPDRTAYNLTREEPNPFHLAEMEREEYERLLRGSFGHVRLHGQMYAPASWLLSDDHVVGGDNAVTLLEASLKGLDSRPGPIYWLGIASDALLPPLGGSALLGADDRDDLARVVAQLSAYEVELEARREALESADAREVKARAQLAAYEQTIQALRERPDDNAT